MATLKRRLYRKNSSGTYDTVYLETSADLITGTLPVSHGGTGVTSLDALKTALGIGDNLSYKITNNIDGTYPTGTEILSSITIPTSEFIDKLYCFIMCFEINVKKIVIPMDIYSGATVLRIIGNSGNTIYNNTYIKLAQNTSVNISAKTTLLFNTSESSNEGQNVFSDNSKKHIYVSNPRSHSGTDISYWSMVYDKTNGYYPNNGYTFNLVKDYPNSGNDITISGGSTFTVSLYKIL